MGPSTKRGLLALVIGFCATYGTLSMNYSWLTPGASSDSVAYLGAAESFARDGTFEVPFSEWNAADSTEVLAHYPPGFPVLISLPMYVGVRSHPAALWVMAASAGIALAFSFLLVAEVFGSTAGVLAALVVFVTPVFAKQLLAVWSEPTYLALTLPMLYLMLKRPRWALAYGLLAAAALSVRYVGAAGSAAAVIWSVLHERGGARRVRAAVLAGAPSLVFLLWWHGIVADTGGTIRQFSLYGGWARNLLDTLGMLPEWLVPMSWPGGLGLALLLLALACALLAASFRAGAWEGTRRGMLLMFGLYSGLYVAVLVASRIFLDPVIPFDARLFLPILLLASLTVASALAYMADILPTPTRWAAVVLAGFWMGSSWIEIKTGVRMVNEIGRFYTFSAWISDPVVRWIDNDSRPFDVIYSNEPELIFYQTGRLAKRLPGAGEDLADFRTAFERDRAAIVMAYPLRVVDTTPQAIARAVRVGIAVQTQMGIVFVPAAPEPGVMADHEGSP